VHTSDCHRNSLVGFTRLQTLPRCGVQIVRTPEIGVDVIGVVITSRYIGDFPIPRSTMFNLSEPDET
jgi:hypothetical protein